MKLTVRVNGASYTREVEPRLLLIHFLRDELRLTGSHWGCDTSNCGACVVWLDETPVKSCTVLAAMADGRRVRTVEGLECDGELQICRCTGYENIVRSVQWAARHEAAAAAGEAGAGGPGSGGGGKGGTGTGGTGTGGTGTGRTGTRETGAGGTGAGGSSTAREVPA